MFRPTTVVLRDGRKAVIRRARPRDAKPVIDHVNAVAAEGIYLLTERLALTPKEERVVFRKHDAVTAIYLVAVEEDEILGTATFSRGIPTKSRHVASLGIILRKDARGIGLGRALMQAGIDWARSVGVQKLTLGVFDSNTAARALYRRLGFVQEGRLKGHAIIRGKPVDELRLSLWL